MPAELTDPPAATRHVSRWWLLRDAVLVLLAFAVGGALCGLVWQWWWTPPTGTVVDHVWYPGVDGVRGLFSGTALYVVVASAGGLVLGVTSAWLFDRVELVTLLAVIGGSVLAAWLMLKVGSGLSPADPQVLARSAPDDTRLRGALEISGTSPLLSLPVGAVAGVAAVFIGLTPNRRTRG